MQVFDKMNISAKQEIIKNYAKLIFAMPYYNYIVRLYSWDRFFIESYYNTEERKITRISVANDADMQKYLAKISLDLEEE